MTNQQMLIGRVGSDIKTYTFPSGKYRVFFSVATDAKYRDKKTGLIVNKVEWHRVACFIQSTNDAIMKVLQKGDMVYVVGRTETQEYKTEGKTIRIKVVMLLDWQKLYTRKNKEGEHVFTGNVPQDVEAPQNFFEESDYIPIEF